MIRQKRNAIKIIKNKLIFNKTKSYKRSTLKLLKQKKLRAEIFSYRDRKNKYRSWNNLWVNRLNNSLINYGIHRNNFNYFIKNNKIILNRHILSQISTLDNKLLKTLYIYILFTLCRT